MSKIISILIIILIKITYQDDIIGFYQEFNTQSLQYTWQRCNSTCYTCNKGFDSDATNPNCLSCNPKQGRYFLDGDLTQNCYLKEELPNSNSITYFLDTRQTPNKWVACHKNCKTCSDKVSLKSDQTTIVQMNCIECKDGYIKVNTFCYPSVIGDTNLGFKVGTLTMYCGDFLDDETDQQLGIYEGGTKCI